MTKRYSLKENFIIKMIYKTKLKYARRVTLAYPTFSA